MKECWATLTLTVKFPGIHATAFAEMCMWLLYIAALNSILHSFTQWQRNNFRYSPPILRDFLVRDVSANIRPKQVATMNRIRSPAFQFDLIDPSMAVETNTLCFDSFPWCVLSIGLSSLLIYDVIITKEYSKRSRTYECRYPDVN